MKVCMITTSFPRFAEDISGVFIYRLCRALLLSGMEVDVVTPADKGKSRMEKMSGIQVHRFRYFFPESWQGLAYGTGGGIPANLKRCPWLLFQVPFFFFMFLIKTLRVSKGADVLHANWIYVGLVAWVVKMIRGIPFVVTLRGSDVQMSQKGRFSICLSRFILHRAAAVTTVSLALKHWVIEQGVPEDRVTFIRNGTDLSSDICIVKDPGICRLLFVGNLTPIKGVILLIKALSSVLKKETRFSLTVIGEGAEKINLEQEVKKYALNDTVKFIGTVSPDRVAGWMSESDCLVLPSLWEGTPNVILEAMACGLPVVASDLPGIRELVTPDLNGLLFQPQDVDALSRHLLKIIQDLALRRRMGQSGREVIVKMGLSWEQTALHYKECYQKVCATV